MFIKVLIKIKSVFDLWAIIIKEDFMVGLYLSCMSDLRGKSFFLEKVKSWLWLDLTLWLAAQVCCMWIFVDPLKQFVRLYFTSYSSTLHQLKFWLFSVYRHGTFFHFLKMPNCKNQRLKWTFFPQFIMNRYILKNCWKIPIFKRGLKHSPGKLTKKNIIIQ